MEEVSNLIERIFSGTGFMPRWTCGIWTETLGWLYILANVATALAYFTIPILLFKFLGKRKETPFINVFICFILFIFFCGTTHLVDALIFWIPVYRLNTLILTATALISWITVFVLYRFLPHALTYQSPDDLQKIIEEQTTELASAYQKLSVSENQFKTLVNSNPDIITRIDKHLTYQFINDSIRHVRRMGADDIIGKKMWEVQGENDSQINELFINNVKSAFATNQAKTFEFETYTLLNKHNYFQLSIIPLTNETGGDPEDVLTITKDIPSRS